MDARFAWLVVLLVGQSQLARAQCVSSNEVLDCCSMFEQQNNYSMKDPETGIDERCVNREPGTVCYAFEDGYVWLLPVVGDGVAQVACPDGVVHMRFDDGKSADARGGMYLHRLDTELVKALRPCSGEGALDPRACEGEVSLGEWSDGGVTWVPVEPLRFDAGADEQTRDTDGGPRDDSKSRSTTLKPPADEGCSVSTTGAGPAGGHGALVAILGALGWARGRRGRSVGGQQAKR